MGEGFELGDRILCLTLKGVHSCKAYAGDHVRRMNCDCLLQGLLGCVQLLGR